MERFQSERRCPDSVSLMTGHTFYSVDVDFSPLTLGTLRVQIQDVRENRVSASFPDNSFGKVLRLVRIVQRYCMSHVAFCLCIDRVLYPVFGLHCWPGTMRHAAQLN
jgi:hypothetical protein